MPISHTLITVQGNKFSRSKTNKEFEANVQQAKGNKAPEAWRGQGGGAQGEGAK